MDTPEKQKALRLADVNGYALAPVGPELPPTKARKRSGIADVREIIVPAVWPMDSDFREECVSTSNKDAVTGSVHADKALAALKIYEYAKARELTSITDLGSKAIGKIARDWLPKILAERGLDRQSRFRQAISDGRAAEVAEHAAEDQS